MQPFNGPSEDILTNTPEKIHQPEKHADTKNGGQTTDRRIGSMREHKFAADVDAIDDFDDEIAQLFGVADGPASGCTET